MLAPRKRATSYGPAILSMLALAAISGFNYTYLVIYGGDIAQSGGSNWGMADFRDAVYYPCRAVMEGVSPYDVTAYRQHFRSQVGNDFPLYSPLILLLHFPLAFLPYHIAAWTYQGIQFAILVICCGFVVRWCGWRLEVTSVCTLAALVMGSEPSRTNLNFGQVTWPLVLASYLALAQSRQRPAWSGAALAIASFKPTYFVCLGFFMLCRGDLKALIYGTTGALLGILSGLGLMAAYGIDVLAIASVAESNYAATLADPTADAGLSIVRVDMTAFLAKALSVPSTSWAMYAGSSLVLVVTGWLVWRETQEPENLSPDSFSVFLICLGSLVGIYHLVYDLILLTLPVVALFAASHPSWRRLPRGGRAFLAVCSMLLALNVAWNGLGEGAARFVASSWPELFHPWSDVSWRVAVLINPTLLALMWVMAVVTCLLPLAWNRSATCPPA